MTTEQAFLDECALVRAAAVTNLARGGLRMADFAAVDALIERFYALPGNEVGGALHVVLDDQNLADSAITWCRDHARGDLPAERLADVLLLFTRAERYQLAIADECTREDFREEGEDEERGRG